MLLGVDGGTGGAVSVGRGSGWDAKLLLDSDEGGRQLPNTASRNADAVGEGMEYSETETDIDGRPDVSDKDVDGRAPLLSTSVSMGVLNDMLSLEYRESLSVRDRALENDGMSWCSLESGDMPRLLL